MRKRVYISADYSGTDGDRDVVDVLNKWGSDDLRVVDFVDTAKVVSGSVSDGDDCRGFLLHALCVHLHPGFCQIRSYEPSGQGLQQCGQRGPDGGGDLEGRGYGRSYKADGDVSLWNR